MGRPTRIDQHREIESELRDLADGDFLRWVSRPALLRRGHGAIRTPRGGARVFVKLLPLTGLELRPENLHSTANLFGLPAFYQYRLGSAGFGAWRELDVHRMANEWVLSGACTGFPLLHGWRILPIVRQGPDGKAEMGPWSADPAIRRRTTAMAEAVSSAVLVLERFPRTLARRFGDRSRGGARPLAGIEGTEAALLGILAFLNDRGVLHMDAHLENVLMDGSGIYLGDFGLATSRGFELDADERAFFDRHGNYDRCTAVAGLVHAVVARYNSMDAWRQPLHELMDGTRAGIGEVQDAVRAYLSRRGPVALEMDDFWRRLRGDLSTEYPAARLGELLQ